MEDYKSQVEEQAKKRLEELLEIAKLENETFDDHGPVILGDRMLSPIFTKEEVGSDESP